MIGGGLGDLWEQAGHEVTRIGRDGGDVRVFAIHQAGMGPFLYRMAPPEQLWPRGF
jgi:hypothetical protein